MATWLCPIEPYGIYRAVVKIRRDDGFTVRPNAEWLDGRLVTVATLWRIDPEENHLYGGEWAMELLDPIRDQGWNTLVWIASGDLVHVRPMRGSLSRTQIRERAATA